MTATNPIPSRPPIPVDYAGKWIAWDSPQRIRIIASGQSYSDAYDAAKATGEADPVLQRVPDRKVRFIGAAA